MNLSFVFHPININTKCLGCQTGPAMSFGLQHLHPEEKENLQEWCLEPLVVGVNTFNDITESLKNHLPTLQKN